MHPLITLKTVNSAPNILTRHRRGDTFLYIGILLVAVSFTPFLVIGGVNSLSLVLGGLAALVVAFLVLNWPIVGFYIVVACTVLVEQDALTQQTNAGVDVPQTSIFTDKLDIFHWPPGLEGLIERPIGFLFIFILLALVLRRSIKHEPLLQGGYFLWPFMFFLFCVVVGIVHGVTSGGDVKIIVIEVRPFWYMFMAYLLACNLVTKKIHLRTFFWLVIIGAGIKSLQGIYILVVLLHGQLTFRNIMAHEESFFFISLMLLVFLLLVYHRYRPQLLAGLLVLPTVVVALVANQRRADYLALLVGLVVAWVFFLWTKPEARKKLIVGMLLCATLGTGYVFTFALTSNIFAEPARAIMSIFQPDPRDAPSNQYRVIENFDLKYTAKQNPLLGLGFGKPFYQPIHLTNIASLDQNYLLIPHNTIYWVWMRLGLLGFLALWLLFGSMITRGGHIIRQLRDSYLKMTAIYIVATVFMAILVASADYQLFVFRNVIFIGLIAGILTKLSTIDEDEHIKKIKEKEQEQQIVTDQQKVLIRS